MYGARLSGHQKLECEVTIRDGKIVYDLNAITRPDWTTLPKDYKMIGDPKWDGLNPKAPN
jgi:dihydroorotase